MVLLLGVGHSKVEVDSALWNREDWGVVKTGYEKQKVQLKRVGLNANDMFWYGTETGEHAKHFPTKNTTSSIRRISIQLLANS